MQNKYRVEEDQWHSVQYEYRDGMPSSISPLLV